VLPNGPGDLRQRAVHREGLQGLHSHHRHDHVDAPLTTIDGKLERYHKTIKETRFVPASPSTLEEARALVTRFVEHYNAVRLHSAIGYITAADFLAGRGKVIWPSADRRLEAAAKFVALRRAEAPSGGRMNARFPYLCFRTLQRGSPVHAEPIQVGMAGARTALGLAELAGSAPSMSRERVHRRDSQAPSLRPAQLDKRRDGRRAQRPGDSQQQVCRRMGSSSRERPA